MRDARGASSSIIAGLLCLIVLAAYAGSVSAGRLTHGFVSYHTAAQLLLEGQMGPQVYDFAWFQQQVQRRTATGVLEIFGPNPPTMSLLALPVAPFDPRTARALWLVGSLVAAAATVILLARDAHQRKARFLMRHWCGPEAAPLSTLGDCSTRVTLAAWLLLGSAVVITGLVVRRAPPMIASAAGLCLSLLCIPIAEDHAFVLLAIPIFALAATPPRWSWVVVAVLVLVPAQLTVERYLTGWLSLLAYPRLYATWWLWALTIHASISQRDALHLSAMPITSRGGNQ